MVTAMPRRSKATPASVRDPHGDRILVLDFGSQYTQLIARSIREAGVYCEIHPFDMPASALRAFGARGVILSGGPESTTAAATPRVQPEVLELGVPVLGICYGMQALAAQLGGRVETATHREYGYAQVCVRSDSALFAGVFDAMSPHGEPLLDVWMSHGDRVIEAPVGFDVVATTANSPLAVIADEAVLLLEALNQGTSPAHIPGVAMRRQGKFHVTPPQLTSFPSGNPHLSRWLDLNPYEKMGGSYTIQSKRGCRMRCERGRPSRRDP